ncbi:MAG: autotransporter-associated beta strand repeat-containing protein [Kiritimatiellae bacterium]|nr:autotransporter-associated beta strand repeat-containing protein [Kiritimatiellia bacterium]
MKKNCFAVVAFAAVFALADQSWMVQDGVYSVGSNWSAGTMPAEDEIVTIGNGGTALITSGDITNRSFYVGNPNNGALRQTGGSYTLTDYSNVGHATGTVGTYTLEDGALTVNSTLRSGRYGRGTFEMTGGTVYVSSNVEVSRYAGSEGSSISISGGTFNCAGSFTVGYSAMGSLTVQGSGVLSVGSALQLSYSSANLGSVNIGSGGTVAAASINAVGGAGSLSVDSGTVRANANSTDAAPLIGETVSVDIGAGGLVVDTQAYSTKVFGTISGLGGITKRGSGAMVLFGANAYTGVTAVEEGVLLAQTPASLPGYNTPGQIVVSDGAGISVGPSWTDAEIQALEASVTYLGTDQLVIGRSYDTSDGDVTISANLNLPLGLTKSGPNMLALTGHNTFGDVATVLGGTLQADFGEGLDDTQPVVLNGGTLSSASGEIIAGLGSSGGQISVPEGATIAGFTARTVPLTVNLGDESGTITYNSELFPVFTLLLNGIDADQPLTFENPLDINGTNCYIEVDANTVTINGTVEDSSEVLPQSALGKLYTKGAGDITFTSGIYANRIYLEGSGNIYFPPGSVIDGRYVKANSSGSCTFDGAHITLPAYNETASDGFNSYNGKIYLDGGSVLNVDSFRCPGGTTYINDATINVAASFYVNNSSTVIQNGGVVNNLTTGENTKFASGSGNCSYTLNDGVFKAAYTISVGAAKNGIANFRQFGGLVDATQYIFLAHNSGSTGNYYLYGGETVMRSQDKGYLGLGYKGIGFLEIGYTGKMTVPYMVRVGLNSAVTNAFLKVSSGGLLSTAEIRGLAGSARIFELNGGTVRGLAKGSGKYNTSGNTFVSDLTEFSVARSGGTFDTDGLELMLAQPMTATNDVGLSFQKLVHRWTFNGNLVDDIGGTEGSASGEFSTDGTTYTLGGGGWGSSQIDLGTNLIPTNGDPVSIEVWATEITAQKNSRIFDIGDSETDFLMMNWSNDTNTGNEKFEVRQNNVSVQGNNKLGGYATGRQYHVALVMEPQPDGSWTITGIKQYGDGTPRTTYTITAPAGWSPATMAQSHFYLGHSMFPADNDANATYDEIRIWNRAITAEEMSNSAKFGLDVPVSMNEEYCANGALRKQGEGTLIVTGHNTYDLPLEILGGTFSLVLGASIPEDQPVMVAEDAIFLMGGNEFTVSGLSGNGTIMNGNVTVTDGIYPGAKDGIGTLHLANSNTTLSGALHIDVGENGESDCLDAPSGIDLSQLNLVVENLDELASGNVYTIATGRLSGNFDGTNLSGTPWMVFVSGNSAKLMTGGTLFMLR